jgi:Ceramidase
MNKKLRIGIILTTTLVAIIITFSFAPIAQDQTYHTFADRRAFFGISNFNDIVSNLLFIIFGLMGLAFLFNKESNKSQFSMHGEQFLWKALFFGVILVGVGSGYYHINPENSTLLWDRLPMTIVFMAFLSLVIMERIDRNVALILFPVLLAIGIGSVFYWDYTESLGEGDLRLYGLVQFLSLLLIAIIFWLFPAKYTGMKYLVFTIGWYALAKLFEYFDKAIFDLLWNMVSGHSLKHIAASIGAYTMLLYVKKRGIVGG